MEKDKVIQILEIDSTKKVKEYLKKHKTSASVFHGLRMYLRKKYPELAAKHYKHVMFKRWKRQDNATRI